MQTLTAFVRGLDYDGPCRQYAELHCRIALGWLGKDNATRIQFCLNHVMGTESVFVTFRRTSVFRAYRDESYYSVKRERHTSPKIGLYAYCYRNTALCTVFTANHLPNYP